jgi:hypothetical protein
MRSVARLRASGASARLAHIAVAGCLATAVVAAGQVPPTPDVTNVAKVLAAARDALGGDTRLSAIKTFTATGRTQQVRGNNLVPIEFEIVCELPDRYRRTDEIPAQESGPTSAGFNGDDLIAVPALAAPPFPSPGRGPSVPPTVEQQDAARRTRTAAVKQDFVRLTLGMFARSFTSYPLTFSYVGRAEAPQGQADVVDVKGPANFALRLFVHSETHLPLMVTWQAAGGLAARGGPGGRGPAGEIENRLYYADYRETDGVRWPFRLRRSAGPETIEETTIDRFKINAKIDAKKFVVTK